MKVIHLGTAVQSLFGVLDDRGNVVRQYPVNLKFDTFDGDPFIKAKDHILEKKAELEKSLNGNISEKGDDSDAVSHKK